MLRHWYHDSGTASPIVCLKLTVGRPSAYACLHAAVSSRTKDSDVIGDSGIDTSFFVVIQSDERV